MNRGQGARTLRWFHGMRLDCLPCIRALLWLIGFLFLVLSGRAVYEENRFAAPARFLEPLRFSGVYQSEEGAAPQKLTEETRFNPLRGGNLMLQGHFDRQVAQGETILLRISDIRARIWLNGKLLYAFAEPGSFPPFVRSPGDVWVSFRAPQAISPQDEVRIELNTLYSSNLPAAFDDFIRQMYTGDSGDLLRVMLAQTGLPVLFALCVAFFGLFLAAAYAVLRLFGTPVDGRPLYLGLFMATSGLWLSSDFNIISLLIPYPVLTTILDKFYMGLITPFFVMYIQGFITSNVKKILFIFVIAFLALHLLYIVTQLFGICQGRDWIDAYIALFLCTMLGVFMSLVYEYLFNRNTDIKFILFSYLAFSISFGDIVTYFMNDLGYVWVFCGFLLFIVLQFFYAVRLIRESIERQRQEARLERELAQGRIARALSQIQPQFLYQSLEGIKALCVRDAQEAEQAVGDFADFMRGNMDSLASTASIPFARELAHTRKYIALERMRCGDLLHVRYAIDSDAFFLPSLSVQPLVENAIRHGLAPKAGGGTVSICAQEQADRVTVSVADDGVGFDPGLENVGKKAQGGLEHVRRRLEALGGSLHVDSVPGKGTIATVTIMKKKSISE